MGLTFSYMLTCLFNITKCFDGRCVRCSKKKKKKREGQEGDDTDIHITDF